MAASHVVEGVRADAAKALVSSKCWRRLCLSLSLEETGVKCVLSKRCELVTSASLHPWGSLLSPMPTSLLSVI